MKYLFPLFQWPFTGQAKLSDCIAKCITTINEICVYIFLDKINGIDSASRKIYVHLNILWKLCIINVIIIIMKIIHFCNWSVIKAHGTVKWKITRMYWTPSLKRAPKNKRWNCNICNFSLENLYCMNCTVWKWKTKKSRNTHIFTVYQWVFYFQYSLFFFLYFVLSQ